MKKRSIAIALLAMAILSGCSEKSGYARAPEHLDINGPVPVEKDVTSSQTVFSSSDTRPSGKVD